MKEIVGNVLLTAMLLFVFFPWIIGVVDILSWALSGAQMTDIPWETNRGTLLAVWPIFCGMVVGGLCVMVGA